MSQFDRIEQSQIEKIAKKVVAASGGGSSGTVTQVNSGTGLSGGPITTTGTLNVSFGTTGTTACVGNDSRLSDARTPTAHTHPQTDVTNLVTDLAGKAASVHTHPQSDVTNLVTDLAGKAATAHTHAAGDVTSGAFNIGRIPTGTTSSTVCIGNDSRLSDARTPLTHTHPQADITNLVTDLAGKAATVHTHAATDITSGTIATARLGSGTANATTFLCGNQTWATPSGGSGSVTIAKSILTATQANSTVTPAVLTGCTFTLTPGQTMTLVANLIFTAAATATGGALGVRVAQAATATANATGSAVAYVNLSSAAAATGLSSGNTFNVAAGASSFFEILGTATTAGNNAARIEAIVWNQASNVNTTVTVEFRSEVAASAVTAQIGSGAVAVIG